MVRISISIAAFEAIRQHTLTLGTVAKGRAAVSYPTPELDLDRVG
jgi:hypothetical protein